MKKIYLFFLFFLLFFTSSLSAELHFDWSQINSQLNDLETNWKTLEQTNLFLSNSLNQLNNDFLQLDKQFQMAESELKSSQNSLKNLQLNLQTVNLQLTDLENQLKRQKNFTRIWKWSSIVLGTSLVTTIVIWRLNET